MVLSIATPGVGVASEAADQLQASGDRLVEQFEVSVRPMLESFCIDCHSADYSEGNVKLDALDPDMVHGDDVERWHAALDAVNAGDMPPEEGDQPSEAERQLLVDWITRSIEVAREARVDITQPKLCRLTKEQYANTLKDLLRLPIDFSESLPSDSPSEMGFHNNAATQQTTALHLEYYEAAARKALSKAIVVGDRPAATRYRVRLGTGVGTGGEALEIKGYQAKAIPREDVAIEFLDEAGQPIIPSDPQEESRLHAIERNIGIDMRGSHSDRFGVTDEGLVLYSALPHVEVSPRSWQGPSPNVQVLFRRCIPDSGPFAFRVAARPSPFTSPTNQNLISLRSDEPLVTLDSGSQPVVDERALVLEASDFKILRNLALKEETLRSRDVTKPSVAVVSFQVETEGLYQLDLVHPVEMGVAMPSIGLVVDGSSEHIQLSGQKNAGDLNRAVTPLMYAQLRSGENSFTIRNKFFGGLSHLVATPLPADHPTVKSLADAEGRNLARFSDATPALQAFAGARTDDGMEYKTFGKSTPVLPGDKTSVYEFFDYLENLPVPERDRDNKGNLSGIAILGLWNNRFVSSRSDQGPPIVVESLELETPYYPVWPPASHTAILFDDAERETDQRGYARRVIARFASRAFRRPATDSEVDRYLGFWENVRGDFATYEEGIREALVPVLCSPSFLYVDSPAAVERDESSYALASKLAFFLWNSPPDERLLDLAESGALRDTLPTTVEIMLADPKAERFVRTFASEWLRLDRHESMSVNARRFPAYNRFVKRDMREETVRFLHEVISQNLSARTLIDSDFVMLNQNLADYYGVAGVEGDRFRPVVVDPSLGRGGLLTHGAFLTGHSDGTHSHPIKRAVWLKERILGDPPPPPPPNVPELDPDTPGFDKLTLKEQLEIHRNKASCVSCHRQIDPFGVLFEGYDAVGKLRTKAGGKPIDARSELPDGSKLNGVVELKRHLIEEAYDDVLHSLCERLFAYATGLNVNYANQPEIDQLVEQAKDDDRLASMIASVVFTESFLGEGQPVSEQGEAE